uniref:Uncharacterized protein n=1 Tax=Arundo donax TaxID=35708 RepID=A0A0A9GPA9_ARUDO
MFIHKYSLPQLRLYSLSFFRHLPSFYQPPPPGPLSPSSCCCKLVQFFFFYNSLGVHI